MLDPFRKKSRVLSRFFGRGRPVPGLRFQTGKAQPRPQPARSLPLNALAKMPWRRCLAKMAW
jgi:hypothetical protein